MGVLPVVRNMLKAWLLLLAFCASLAAIGWLLGGFRILSILVFSGLLLGAAVYVYAERIPLGMLRARELPVGEAPAVHSTVARLAARAGLPPPRLYVLAEGHPLILSSGRGPRGSGIALSSGLLAASPPAELEGLIAHEIAHVGRRDVLVQTLAAIVGVTLLEATRIGGFLQRALLYVFGPIAAAIVHGLLSEKREYAADRAAAELCGSPHGLADALVRLEHASELVWFEGSPAIEPLYAVNPFAEEQIAAMFVTHPPLHERVRRLRALDLGSHEKSRAA